MSQPNENIELALLNPENCDSFLTFLENKQHHDEHEHDHSHHHDHDHCHGIPADKHDSTKLMVMIGLNAIFFLAELITGFITKSLAMQSDAFHMLSDEAGLIVGLVAHKMSRKPPTPKMSFGWARAEVLGGLANSIFLLAVCLMLFFDCIERFIEPHQILEPILFLVVGFLGLAINIVGMFVFHDHSHSDNLRGVFLHIFGDFLGSIGVIISACIVTFTNWSWKYYVDPIISIFIVIILVNGSMKLAIKTSKKVIERCPDDIDAERVNEELLKIGGILAVHELHIWELSRDHNIALIHIVIDSREKSKLISQQVSNLLLGFGVYSTTIQSEYADDFPEGVDKTASCFYGSTIGHEKRVFSTTPVFHHTIGCPHVNIPGSEPEHHYDHDHEHCHDHDHEHCHDHDHEHEHGHGFLKGFKGRKKDKPLEQGLIPNEGELSGVPMANI